MNAANIPLSLYVHLPWCIRKCPYCDFNSHALKSEIPEQEYLKKLLADLQQDLPLIHQRPLSSIFIGGGTPSLFSGKFMTELLVAIDKLIAIGPGIEITLEANPGTVEQKRFNEYRQGGINRLSIGCQSFDDEKLKILGRIHGRDEALRAYESAINAGFDNINIDLMYGLPEQNATQALEDLSQGLALHPWHLSWYQLTLEPNTLFYAKPPKLPESDGIDEIELAGRALLHAHGFCHYEISAYCQPEKHSRHNLNYWQYGDYLGIGAGAHGKITLVDGQIIRTVKHKHPRIYLDSTTFHQDKTFITMNELPFEFMLNTLRLNQPLDLNLFEQRTGLPEKKLTPYLLEAQKRGFIKKDFQEHVWVKTSLGERFLNDLIEIFL